MKLRSCGNINKDATVLANKYVEVQKDDKNSCVLFVHTL